MVYNSPTDWHNSVMLCQSVGRDYNNDINITVSALKFIILPIICFITGTWQWDWQLHDSDNSTEFCHLVNWYPFYPA